MNITRTKKNGEWVWKLDYRVNGVRHRRFFATKGEAEAEGRTQEKDVRQLGSAFVDLGVEARAEILTVVRQIEEKGLTLSQVWREFQRTWRPAEQVASAKALESLLETKRRVGRRDSSINSLRWNLTPFIRGREQKPIADYTVQDITDWINRRKAPAWTRKGELACISNLFAHAKKQGWVQENIADRVDRITVPRSSVSIITNDQCRSILWCTYEHRRTFVPALALLLFEGVRPEECEKLTWDDIDVARGILRISERVAKTRVGRFVTLKPTTIEWLKLGGVLPITSRRRHIRALRDALKLKVWPKDVLRHTAASHALALTPDVNVVARALGNSPTILWRHYHHLVTPEQANEFFALTPAAVVAWGRNQGNNTQPETTTNDTVSSK